MDFADTKDIFEQRRSYKVVIAVGQGDGAIKIREEDEFRVGLHRRELVDTHLARV